MLDLIGFTASMFVQSTHADKENPGHGVVSGTGNLLGVCGAVINSVASVVDKVINTQDDSKLVAAATLLHGISNRMVPLLPLCDEADMFNEAVGEESNSGPHEVH